MRGASNTPSVRYRTIVADPPWDQKFAKGLAGWRTNGRVVVSTQVPYKTLSVAEICALPVSVLAHPDSWLFLWTTNRYLPQAFSVLEAWGFTYRQTVVWDKGRCMPLGGCVTPNRAEFLLVARRGSARLTGSWPGGSVITATKGTQQGEHSKKPEVFLDLVETVSAGPYLELFARRQRLGWDTWGNEALEHVELPAWDEEPTSEELAQSYPAETRANGF